MAVIKIKRSYTMAYDDIKSGLEGLVQSLEKELDLACKWHGDEIQFKRSGGSGFLRFGEGNLEMEVKIGMMMKPFEKKIRSTIEGFLDEHLH